MKKIIALFILTFFVSVKPTVQAATPTISPTSTPSATTVIDKLKQIQNLKEKIATKVAQLRENEKAGVDGVIKSVTNTAVVLSAGAKEQAVSYSEDTIFFKMTDGVKSDPIDWTQSKKLKEGDQITALGYYNTDHTDFSAKYIYMHAPLLHLIGKIAETDKTNYTITVTQPKGNTVIDIETSTKIYSYDKKSGLAKSGFSKLREGDFVHLFATANPKEETRVSAVKIVDFSFTNQAAGTPSPTPTKEASPSAKPTIK